MHDKTHLVIAMAKDIIEFLFVILSFIAYVVTNKRIDELNKNIKRNSKINSEIEI